MPSHGTPAKDTPEISLAQHLADPCLSLPQADFEGPVAERFEKQLKGIITPGMPTQASLKRLYDMLSAGQSCSPNPVAPLLRFFGTDRYDRDTKQYVDDPMHVNRQIDRIKLLFNAIRFSFTDTQKTTVLMLTDQDGNNLLHLMAKNGRSWKEKDTIWRTFGWKTFLRAISAKNNEQLTPFMLACAHHHHFAGMLGSKEPETAGGGGGASAKARNKKTKVCPGSPSSLTVAFKTSSGLETTPLNAALQCYLEAIGVPSKKTTQTPLAITDAAALFITMIQTISRARFQAMSEPYSKPLLQQVCQYGTSGMIEIILCKASPAQIKTADTVGFWELRILASLAARLRQNKMIKKENKDRLFKQLDAKLQRATPSSATPEPTSQTKKPQQADTTALATASTPLALKKQPRAYPAISRSAPCFRLTYSCQGSAFREFKRTPNTKGACANTSRLISRTSP